MRVLHVIESLEFGGAEKVLADLVNSMAGRCEIGICCVKRTGELESSLDKRVRLYCLNMGEGNHYSLPSKIAGVIRAGRYNVVHSHTWGVYVESALAALMARVPVVVHTVHGLYLEYHPGVSSRVKMKGRHAIERLLARAHHKIVTVSDAIQEYVKNEIGIPASKLVTIHNGVEDAPVVPRFEQLGRELEFITVGRLAAVKNYQMLLRAFAKVLRIYPGSRLQIVGDGPERAFLERGAQELGIAASVRFSGFQSEVHPLLAGSDVFVLSSHYEGISIAVLEAMRASLPVIATRVGGMSEVVVDLETGILVPDNDEDAMALAMERLIESPSDRLQMGNRGRDYMHREFAIQTVADRYLSLYSRTE